MKRIFGILFALVLVFALAEIGVAAPVFAQPSEGGCIDDFSTDTGLRTYWGSAYRDDVYEIVTTEQLTMVPVPGNPGSLVIDSQGSFAYITNGNALLVLDLTTLQVTKNYPLTVDVGALDDIHQSDNLVALHGFRVVAIADVMTGAQEELFQGWCVTGATFAHDFLYASDWNNRVVHVASIDSSVHNTINPYPGGGKLAAPCSIVSSSDGSRVIFGDEFNNALHVIRTSDDTVIATITIGFKPGHIGFRDSNNAIVVHGSDGTIVLVDLTDPYAVPDSFQVDSLESVRSVAVDSTGTRLFVAHQNVTVGQPEVVILDLTTETVSDRILVEGASAVNDIALTPDDNTLLLACTEGIYFLTVGEPVVTTAHPTDITTSSAILHGRLDTLGIYSSVNVSFTWGQTQGGPYPNETTAETMNMTGAFSAPLDGLSDNATYYFRAKVTADSVTVYGDELSFTTYRRVVANFSAEPIAGEAPLTVEFANESTGDITECSWDFGDGGTSDEQSPFHTYTIPGTYNVSLSVNGPGGTDIETKEDYITVYEEVVADFSAEPTVGVAPLLVEFTNKSTGDITECSWDFGDGGTSDEQSPFHTYTIPGTYNVSLTVSGLGGTSIETKTDYIAVYAQATVDFDPDILNLKSKGKWVTVYIELLEGYDIWDIDGGTVLLNDEIPPYLGKQGWAKAGANDSNIIDHDGNGIMERMVKFDRETVQAILELGDQVQITITGKVAGVSFKGVVTIRVIDKGKGK